MQVLVIGANGNTGRRIVRRLARGPHRPVAMIRDAGQRAAFDTMKVPVVLADLEHPIDHAFRGCDAAIFAAGSGGHTGKDKTVLVDHLGAIRAAVGAQVLGCRRFVMLSALNADVASQSGIKHYHRAKGHADAFLRSMHEVLAPALDWTVVCPGSLTDDAGTGCVRVAPDAHGSGRTSRDDLAAALVACLDLPGTIGKTFSLLEGPTPLAEALRAL